MPYRKRSLENHLIAKELRDLNLKDRDLWRGLLAWMWEAIKDIAAKNGGADMNVAEPGGMFEDVCCGA